MTRLKKFFSILYNVGRLYSIPITIFAWIIPFFYCAFDGGNIVYGFLALIGIIFLHAGVNSFDDVVDYIKESKAVNSGVKQSFDFQNGKCICIFNGDLTLKQYLFISLSFIFIAVLFGLFFLHIYGLKLLYIIIPSGILCILYPFCSYAGLGEVTVGLVYAPLLYSGVCFVMKGYFDSGILPLSVSTALLTIAILHNHMLLDYKIDTSARKTTLCRISGSQENALRLLIILIVLAYMNLFFVFISKGYNYFYLLPFLSFPQAAVLIKTMNTHIINPDEKIKYNIFMGDISAVEKAPYNQQNFLLKFLLAQNLLTSFTIYLCIAVILDKLCTL